MGIREYFAIAFVVVIPSLLYLWAGGGAEGYYRGP